MCKSKQRNWCVGETEERSFGQRAAWNKKEGWTSPVESDLEEPSNPRQGFCLLVSIF